MMRARFRTRLIEPVRGLLRQGIAPDKIALSIALGITLSTIPVLGVSTVLCLATAILLRLNLVAMQIGNWAASILQLALMPPFFLMGACIFGPAPAVHESVALAALFGTHLSHSLKLIESSAVRAVAAWAITAPFILGAMYCMLKLLLSRIMNDQGRA